MGEVLILIIIALVWGFKAAVANENKKVNDRETGSISSTPDELIKKAKRTAEDFDALRGQTEKKRPDPLEIKARHNEKGRMTHCPKRFWADMTEMKEELK